MAAPSVLFATSTKQFQPQEFVKQILNVPELPPSCSIRENVCAYDWHVDTKYYTTDVQLCTVQERTIGDQEFAESVEAFVIFFDPKQMESFQLVKSWMPYLEQIEPEVQILVCENCSHDDAVSRLTAQMWCIENSFELVELNPLNDDDDDDVEDDFVETTGIKRIVQALHAHSWPNLILKENPDICSPYFKQLMQEEANKTREERNKSTEETCEDLGKTFSSISVKHQTDAEIIDWEGCEFQTAKTDNSSQSENKKDDTCQSQNETDNCSKSQNEMDNCSKSQNKTYNCSKSQIEKDNSSESQIEKDNSKKPQNETHNCGKSQNEMVNSSKSQSETFNSAQSGTFNSNLKNKDTCSSGEACICGEIDGKETTKNQEDSTKAANKTVKTAEERIDSLLPTGDMSLFAALGNEDLGNESFEELFHQLSSMKETASKLQPNERKVYAEKIAIKFWKAIGGDDDEIDGLSDNDNPEPS